MFSIALFCVTFCEKRQILVVNFVSVNRLIKQFKTLNENVGICYINKHIHTQNLFTKISNLFPASSSLNECQQILDERK